MRVLIVSQYFWPESFRINDLALGLRERGHDVVVLTGVPNYPGGAAFDGYGTFPKREVYEGVDVVRVPMITRGRSRGLRLPINYASFAASASLLGPMRVKGDFDAVFVFEPSPITVGLPAIVMSRVKSAPILFWVQDLWPETLTAAGAVKSPWVLRQVDRLVRFIYKRCARVLVQSRAFQPHVESQGVPPERIEYFPNWAEGIFEPVDLEPDAPEHAELPEGFRILFAGNIGVSQSFETILEAAELTRDVPEIQWCILGDGREKDRVAAEINSRRLDDTVHLLGRRPVETMPRYYAAADALLCTLKRDPVFAMTIPSKVQSYLACERPILAALDGEGADVVREAAAGRVCPAEDAAGLAAAARELYSATEVERRRMGTNGRRYYERHFEREQLLDRLERMLEEAAGVTNENVKEDVRCAA